MDMNDYVYQDLMEELRDRRTDATEMDARIRQLLGDTEQLRKERDELCQRVENIKSGFEGCCYSCEPVGEMNKKLLKERDEAREIALKYEDRYFSALVERDDARWWAKEAIDEITKERDEARREICVLQVLYSRFYHVGEEKECAKDRGWGCYKKEETS
jgi:chromosome segregation ATPase